MGASRLACPLCRTQFHGNHDVCPFCHQCIHLRGGHRCVQCGIYLPTQEQLRTIERSMREAVVAEDQREMVRRNLTLALPKWISVSAALALGKGR